MLTLNKYVQDVIFFEPVTQKEVSYKFEDFASISVCLSIVIHICFMCTVAPKQVDGSKIGFLYFICVLI